jgi:hypothetical protein
MVWTHREVVAAGVDRGVAVALDALVSLPPRGAVR